MNNTLEKMQYTQNKMQDILKKMDRMNDSLIELQNETTKQENEIIRQYSILRSEYGENGTLLHDLHKKWGDEIPICAEIRSKLLVDNLETIEDEKDVKIPNSSKLLEKDTAAKMSDHLIDKTEK